MQATPPAVYSGARRRSSSGDGRGPQNRSDRASRSGGFDSRPPPPACRTVRTCPEETLVLDRSVDPRRRTPRTDTVLGDPRLAPALDRLGRVLVKAAVDQTLA